MYAGPDFRVIPKIFTGMMKMMQEIIVLPGDVPSMYITLAILACYLFLCYSIRFDLIKDIAEGIVQKD